MLKTEYPRGRGDAGCHSLFGDYGIPLLAKVREDCALYEVLVWHPKGSHASSKFVPDIVLSFLLAGHLAVFLLCRHVDNNDSNDDDSHARKDTSQRADVVRLARKIALRFFNPANV